MAAAGQRLQAIRQAQAAIRQRIAGIQAQLADLEAHDVPASQPWISFRRVQSVAELADQRHGSIYDALRSDILTLKRELAALQNDLRREQKQAARGSAVAATADFDQKLRRILKEGEQDGAPDAAAIDGLRREQERALGAWIGALRTDPSDQNMSGALGQMANGMLVGLDDRSPRMAELMQALRGAAGQRRQAAEAQFRRRPTVANLKRYLDRLAQSQWFGEDYGQQRPAGLRRLRPELSHKVGLRETLASIARSFYGSESYWDLIYLANLGVIGGDPERLPVGAELQIP